MSKCKDFELLNQFCIEEDFSDLIDRLEWCNRLKICLLSFGESCKEKYLLWFISTINDIFAYNSITDMTNSQLKLIQVGLKIIYKQKENCSKDSFEEYYLQLCESEITLLPTSQKAIDEFGE